MASIGSNSSVEETDVVVPGADIVVALTSFNDARTIGSVTEAVCGGLERYFGSSSTRIVIADAGSTDGTPEAARQVARTAALIDLPYTVPAGLAEMPYHGLPGRAGALRSVLQAAQRAGVKACAFVDAGLETVEPEWVERLIAPVLNDGIDYVSPRYQRRVNEGAITKGIVYPMFRALFGVQLRQPAAGEFGCSARLGAHYLEQDFWDVEQAQVGIDLWLAVTAVCGEFRTCEALLGRRLKRSVERRPDLSTTLAQVVGALFAELEHRVDVWQRIRGSAAVPIVGTVPAVDLENPSVNVAGLTESFQLGYRELREIWTWVLPPRTIVELRKLTETPADRFQLGDRLWAGIIYDFAIGYALHVMPREHLLRSLAPLYSGWLASFLIRTQAMAPAQIETQVEQVCVAFEAEKRYLISRWRWPERLR